MTNWVLCPVRNNLHLTRKAVETFRAQDIGDINILIIDNGSTDGTGEWLKTQHDLFRFSYTGHGLSVAASWNTALKHVLGVMGESYALVVNNDVELRPDTYRHLVSDGGGFVTAVGSRDPAKIEPALPMTTAHFAGSDKPAYSKPMGTGYLPPDPTQKRPHPDFSCYLIRRETYTLVGPFDENFKIAFCEDWDYHLRMHQAGVRAEALELPFLHHASQTVKNADDTERERIVKQAELNREYFFEKWGVRGGTPEYYALFGNTAPAPADEETGQ